MVVTAIAKDSAAAFSDIRRCIHPTRRLRIELAQRLQQDKPELKVIYASGYSAEVVGGDFSGRQGLDFIAKPYTPTDLIGILERMAASLPKDVAAIGLPA